MATFYKKISNEEIAAIRRVMRDCLQQTRAASCHNVVGELDTILLDVESRPNLAEPDGRNNARVDENENFCEQKWDDNLSEPLSKLFTPNRAGKLEEISNWSAWWGTIIACSTCIACDTHACNFKPDFSPMHACHMHACTCDPTVCV